MNETHAQHFRSPTLHILTPTRMSFIFIDSNVIEFFPFTHSLIHSIGGSVANVLYDKDVKLSSVSNYL